MNTDLCQAIERAHRALNRQRIEIENRRILIQRLGRGFLVQNRNKNRVRNIVSMPTIFNPYDAKIDLTTKDGKKMYMDACKDLKEKDLYDGTKKN